MLLLPFFLACVPVDDGKLDGNDTSGGTEQSDSGPLSYDTYACGWEKRDPGTLSSTGSKVGDVLADVAWMDQCGEEVRVWDMYGKYFILFLTAAW